MTYELLGIEDLVKAKKTQRDKDWPMIRRLVDAHYDEIVTTRPMIEFVFGFASPARRKCSSSSRRTASPLAGSTSAATFAGADAPRGTQQPSLANCMPNSLKRCRPIRITGVR